VSIQRCLYVYAFFLCSIELFSCVVFRRFLVLPSGCQQGAVRGLFSVAFFLLFSLFTRLLKPVVHPPHLLPWALSVIALAHPPRAVFVINVHAASRRPPVWQP